MFPIMAGNSASTGYNLARSLRWRNSASAYLNRTPASATNRQTWTYSAWVKLTPVPQIGGFESWLLSTKFNGVAPYATKISIGTDYKLTFASYDGSGGSPSLNLVTAQVFRDYSAWYHIVVVADTTQATAANRAKMYVNGVQVTSFSTATYPAQNYNTYVNNNDVTVLGALYYSGGGAYLYLQSFDGYLTEINFIDGQALTPSSFGSTNATTGVWQPARYAGSYGTNGFYLPFTDNSALTTSSNVGLGKDFSGNGNYWTTNNISITAGVTYDSMTDVPTLTSATAANFATLNPLRPTGSGGFSNGNLTGTGETGAIVRGLCSTIVLPWTGKWYAEVVFASHPNNWCGVTANDFLAADINTAGQMSVLYYATTGNKWVNGTNSAYGASYTTETIGIAFDGAAGTITFYKSNVSQGAITLPSSTVQYVFCQANAAAAAIAANWNFGQRPFTYTPPTGFVSLNTYNLPTSTILQGNKVMDATLYTGTGASLSVTNAASFKPDLVWVKGRSGATDHALYDSVRGTTKQLESNTTTAETTEATGLTAFGSAGFTVGALAQMNTSAATYVGWQWQAGQGSSSSNTNGTITSTVSVNASAGFSVVTYTGNGTAGATVGHGLGVAPAFIINKSRSAVISWAVYHSALTGTAGIFLDQATGAVTNSGYWNNTNPTSSVFSIGNSTLVNVASQTQVAYCWTPIEGYSSFGKYIGNGSTDGVFVYTPFRPKFVIIKRTDTTGDWYTFDSSRDLYNATSQGLSSNSSAVEGAYTGWGDLLSNGFKIRRTDGAWNASGGTYIYMAFAESPFRNSLAR